jgi:hypothetical protein
MTGGVPALRAFLQQRLDDLPQWSNATGDRRLRLEKQLKALEQVMLEERVGGGRGVRKDELLELPGSRRKRRFA